MSNDKTKAEPVVKVTSLDAFKTRKVSNDGVWIPLKLPGGQLTDAKLHILGIDSDRFRNEVDRGAREQLALASRQDATKEEKEALALKCQRTAAATLVDAWINSSMTSPAPLTVEQVLDLFDESPFIRDMVDAFAAKRAHFFEAWSSSSSATSGTEPSSTADQTGQTSPTQST